ncbi:MAG: DNA polymerase III subunit [Lachnospiraceae bacterium]|jgi:DNA polymerase-3 subunit delta'|nr:DNA polymerase III subunit [Lachnospiraceae bacterium]
MAGFGDIIGQEHIREHLMKAIKTGKVSHAYIISGERSMGKEFIAKVFTMAIQCESTENEKPCQTCVSCEQALSDNHPDIRFIIHEKPGVIGVEDIRRQINEDVGVMPYRGTRKIYVISEAEKMTPQAQNALLKTLEEPPSYAVIILLTANSGSLLPTITSRAALLHMKAVTDTAVRGFLMETMMIPDYRADVCVAFARGNIGRAKLLAASEELEKVKDEAIVLLKNINHMDVSEIIAAIRKIKELKFDIGDYLDFLSIWYRDVLLYKATRDISLIIFKEERDFIRQVASVCAYEGIEEIIEALAKAKTRLDANVNFELTLELLLFSIKDNQQATANT